MHKNNLLNYIYIYKKSVHNKCFVVHVDRGAFLGFHAQFQAYIGQGQRRMFGLPGDPAPDWSVQFLFECCALSQEHTQLRLRGLHPSLGT